VSSGPLVCLSDDHDVEDSLEEQMEPIEAQGQAMARQMAQITHLVENALRIQPSPIPIPNDNRYASSAPGTLVPTEDQPPSTPTPVSVQAAPSSRVKEWSHPTTTSVLSSLPPIPHQPHPDPKVSMTVHSSTPLTIPRTDHRPAGWQQQCARTPKTLTTMNDTSP
jgi:hypothetical protein